MMVFDEQSSSCGREINHHDNHHNSRGLRKSKGEKTLKGQNSRVLEDLERANHAIMSMLAGEFLDRV